MSLNLEEYAGKTEFPLADKGDYEIVLKAERKSVAGTGKEYVNLDFKIREDVDQTCKGIHVFDKAWQDKTNPQWFDLKKLGTLITTQKNTSHYKTQFEEVDECIQYLNGLHMIVSIDKVFDDYTGKEVNQIVYLSYKPSKWDLEPHEAAPVAPVASSSNLDSIEIPDSDLPF